MTSDESSTGQGGGGAKTTRKTAGTRKKPAAKKTARKKAVAKTGAQAAASRPPERAPSKPSAPLPPPSGESEGGMRGIVALWGPLTIIVFLIIVSRLGGDAQPAGAPYAGSQEAITGSARADGPGAEMAGDSAEIAAALGVADRDTPAGDLAAAFRNTGDAGSAADSAAAEAALAPPPPPPATSRGMAATMPRLPPAGDADNPWAPGPDADAFRSDPYAAAPPPPPPAGVAPGYDSGRPRAAHRYGPPQGRGPGGPAYGQAPAYAYPPPYWAPPPYPGYPPPYPPAYAPPPQAYGPGYGQPQYGQDYGQDYGPSYGQEPPPGYSPP